jgi:hypothetical protein
LFSCCFSASNFSRPNRESADQARLASEKIEARIEQKGASALGVHATGFVRVRRNLGVLVAWVVLSANAHGARLGG